MQKTIPSKVVEVCDFCESGEGTWIKKCKLCGKSYCPACAGVCVASYRNPPICETCKTKEIMALCDDYAERVSTILNERDKIIVSGLPVQP